MSQDAVFGEIGITKRGVQSLFNPQTLNAYGYANDNPIIIKDPLGEFGEITMTWTGTAWPLTLADGPLPFGDGVYVAGAIASAGTDMAIAIGDKIGAATDMIKKAWNDYQGQSGNNQNNNGKKDKDQKSNKDLTNKDFRNMAKDLGMKETKEFGNSKGELIFQKGNKYYSGDNTGHNGGVWKVFEKQSGKLVRIGTADNNLNIFKE